MFDQQKTNLPFIKKYINLGFISACLFTVYISVLNNHAFATGSLFNRKINKLKMMM